MKPFIDAMVVAHKLQIPRASFGKFMVRKLLPLARDYLIDLDTVRKAYDTGDGVYNELDIRELCVKSIFEHWFAWKLDGDEESKLGYMCELGEMRENIPELDSDLHKAVEDKDTYLKESKKKRQQDQDQQNSADSGVGGADGGNDGWADHSTDAAIGGGENSWADADATSGGGADWMNNGATGEWAAEGGTSLSKGGNDWAGEADRPVNISFDDGVGSGNWADDMNGDSCDPITQSFNPAPVSGGW